MGDRSGGLLFAAFLTLVSLATLRVGASRLLSGSRDLQQAGEDCCSTIKLSQSQGVSVTCINSVIKVTADVVDGRPLSSYVTVDPLADTSIRVPVLFRTNGSTCDPRVPLLNYQSSARYLGSTESISLGTSGQPTNTCTPSSCTASVEAPELPGPPDRLLSMGVGSGFAQNAAGDVWGWGTNGDNLFGVQRQGDFVYWLPEHLPWLKGALVVSNQYYHTCAIMPPNNVVKCAGYNAFGQLGTGKTTSYAQPVTLSVQALEVATGVLHTCAILTDRTVSCWGQLYYYYAIGIDATQGGRQDIRTPTPVSGLPVGYEAVSIAAGDFHTCVVLADGTSWCWGYSYYGQLGTEPTPAPTYTQIAPKQVSSLGENVKRVKAGGSKTCWLLEDDSMRCAGYNGDGAFGVGTRNLLGPAYTPVEPTNLGPVVDVAIGKAHVCVLVNVSGSSEVRCAGDNRQGVVGRPTDTDFVLHFRTVPGTTGATGIAAGDYSSCAVIPGESVPIKCWGDASYGRLGIGRRLTKHPDALIPDLTPQVYPSGHLVATTSTGSCPLQVSLQIKRTCPATISCPVVEVECGAASMVNISTETFSTACTASPSGASLKVYSTLLPCDGGPYYVWVAVSAPGAADGGASIAVLTKDLVPPTVALPISEDPDVSIEGNTVTVQASSADGAGVSVMPTATDAAEGSTTVSCGNSYPGTLPIGNSTINCTASDTAGNQQQFTFYVLVQDSMRPTFVPSLKEDVLGTANRRENGVAGLWFPASDDNPLTVHVYDFDVEIFTVECKNGAGSVIDVTQAVFMPAGETVITCTATDASGNQAVLSYKVIITDEPPTPPSITTTEWPVQANNTNGWVSVDGSKSFTLPTFHDTVDGDIQAKCNVGPMHELPMGPTAVTCTATDRGGHTSESVTFTLVVQDNVRLLLSNLVDVKVESDITGGARVPLSPVAVDGVKGDVSSSVVCTMPGFNGTPVSVCTLSSGCEPTLFPLGPATEVTCSVNSYRTGVTETKSISVEVADTVKPVVVGLSGAHTVYEATSATGYRVDLTALVTATDINLQGGISCSPPAGEFAMGVTSVTCTAQDASGNKESLAFDIKVVDMTAPTILVTAPGAQEATDATGAVVVWSEPTVSDTVTPVDQLKVACDPSSGAVFALGDTPVRCTVTDKAGNNATTSFSVTVVDTTPPQLTGVSPGIKVYSNASSEKVTWPLPTAKDAVTAEPEVECKPASGSTFQVDTTTVVTCTARDAANNTASSTFEVSVVDGADPAIQVPQSATFEAQGPAGADWPFTRNPTFGAVFSDRGVDVPGACYGLSCSPTSCKFPLGLTEIICNATDASNRTGSASFTVTVVDTTPPKVDFVVPSLTEATSPQGASVTFSVTASDLVDGPVVPVVTPLASGSTFPIGSTKVTVNATDTAGNSAPLGVLQVVVQDTTPPTVTIAEPRDITVDSLGIDGEPVTWSSGKAQASDIADTSPTVKCMPASGFTFRPGATTVTCTAADKYGNVSPGSSFTVFVKTPIDLITDILNKFSKKPIQGRVIAALLDALKTMGGKPRRAGDKDLLCKLVGGVAAAVKGDSSSTSLMSKISSGFKC